MSAPKNVFGLGAYTKSDNDLRQKSLARETIGAFMVCKTKGVAVV